MSTDVSHGIPVSVIVLTYNEVVNIAACVDALTPFDEIIVVDSGSTDGTLEVLRERFPHVRVLHNAFEDFGQQRNWALDQARPRNEWVLFFDADERCTSECAAAIDTAVANGEAHDGYFLCYRNMFLGRWIRRSTMFPTWQLRLLRVGSVRYQKEGHGQREVMAGSPGYIGAPYDHHGFSKGVSDWIVRHDRYSSAEVELIEATLRAPLKVSDILSSDPVLRRRCLKRLGARMPLRPLVRFLHTYVLKLGVLDGRPGLVYCLLQYAHEVHILAKREELKYRRQTEPIAADATSRSELATKIASP